MYACSNNHTEQIPVEIIQTALIPITHTIDLTPVWWGKVKARENPARPSAIFAFLFLFINCAC
ncbi:hypothetical protein KSZ_62940 [Dictyobacter formicarum]|uniref:Uncharacterized protein n=1 Tax=Dictyobacter formicarum TaxID=2778368 RepID=A0ABQ3VR32_9CHLR|nr:hypothetical protein KSZ_62940 [Dictyobacter formicarum]